MTQLRNRRARDYFQDYRNRSYVACELDDATFDLWSELDIDMLATTGCLDALQTIPAGGMEARCGFYDSIVIDRGTTLQEQKEFLELINGI